MSGSPSSRLVLALTASEPVVQVARAFETHGADVEVQTAVSAAVTRALGDRRHPDVVVVSAAADADEIRRLFASADAEERILVDAERRLTEATATDLGATRYVQSVDDLDVEALVEQSSASTTRQTGASHQLPADLGLEAFDNIQDVIYVFDADGNFVWWNSRLEAVTGLPPERIRTMGPTEFFEGTDREKIGDAFRRATDGERVKVEANLVTDADERRPYEFTAMRLERPNWDDAYVCGIGRDVSARVERERRLEATERQMDAIFQDPTSFVFRLNPDGRLQKANATALEFADASLAAVRDEPFWELPWWTRGGEARDTVRDAVERAADGEFVQFQTRHRRHDDATRTFKYSVRPVTSDGEVVGVLAQAVDVTERERLREELSEAFERVNDALFAVNRDWEFTYANDRALELSDTTRAEILGESFWDVFPAALGTDYERYYRRAMTEQEQVTFEEYYEPLDMWTEVRAYPSETGLSIYYQDVTERRQNEIEREVLSDTIQIAAEAASFEQAVEDVLATVCSRTKLVYGEAWIPRDGALHKHTTYATEAAEIDSESLFVRATEALSFAPGVGLPGRVWERNEPEWIDDLGSETGFVRSDVVRETGLQSAVGVPIVADGETLAVLTFFLSGSPQDEDRLVSLLSSIASEVGGVIVRQRTVSELRRQREVERQLFNTSPVGIAIANGEGELVRVNDRLCEILQLENDEILDRAYFDDEWDIEDASGGPIPPKQLPIGRVLTTGDSVFGYEHALVRGDGTRKWVKVNASPLYDEGELDYIVTTVQDITDQRWYQESLTTIRETFREMIGVESREEIVGLVVEAAEQFLDAPVVAAYLLDTTAGGLYPAAISDATTEYFETLPVFNGGDSWVWDAYVSGESAVVGNAERDAELPSASELPSKLAVPLGDHGIFLTCAPERDWFDEDVVELAEILAANASTSLQRTEQAMARREREEALAEKTEQLTSARRINDVISQIHTSISEAFFPEQILPEVCRRLVDEVPEFEFAWAGATRDAEGGVEPVANTGGYDALVDREVALATAGRSGHSPVRDALDDGEIRRIENILDEDRYETWSNAVLREGLYSVVAIPILFRAQIHGVVMVYSTAPGTFDDALEDVFAELSEAVGSAMTAAERTKFLLSGPDVELEFELTSLEGVVSRVAARYDTAVEVTRITVREDGDWTVTLTADSPVDVDAVTPPVGVRSVETTSDGESLTVVAAESPVAEFVTLYGGRLEALRVTPDGEAALTVQLSEAANASSFVDVFTRQFPDATLTRRVHLEEPQEYATSAFERALTDRQREVIEVAFESGYFDRPRSASSEEVAALLDISKSTFHEHLRNAQRSLFAALLG